MTQPINCFRLDKKNITVHSICVFLISIYMMLLPFEYVWVTETGSINKYLGIVIAAFCLLSGSFKFRYNGNILLIVCFLIYGVISGLWAISISDWNEVFFIYLKNAALFLVIVQCDFTEKNIEFNLNFYVIGSLLLAIYLITSANATIDPYSGRTVIEVNGGYFDPNYMAADIIIPIGYMYGVFYDNIIKKNYVKSFLSLLVILVLFYIEILSGSRGGLIAILAMIFTITILKLKDRKVRKKILFIILALIFVYMIISRLIPEQIVDRFSLDSLSGKTDGGSGRINIWNAAWKGIKDNFIFGYGAGCTLPAIGIYHTANRAAHSLYLSAFLEFGIFAMLLFLAMFFEVKKSYNKNLHVEVGMAAGILISSIFLDSLTTKFFWTFLMFLFMRNSIKTQE